MAAAADPSADCNEPRPPQRLGGEIRVDETSRAAAANDFGHIVHKTPAGVLFPVSDEDVAATIRWAHRHRIEVASHGQRHSVYGRQTDGGVVVDMSQLTTVHTVETDRVVVDAGATWHDVLAATLPRGRTPPVLAKYLQLSVGGTVVIGGFGDTTSRFGMQSDNALELEVVAGQGRRVRCSARRGGP